MTVAAGGSPSASAASRWGWRHEREARCANAPPWSWSTSRRASARRSRIRAGREGDGHLDRRRAGDRDAGRDHRAVPEGAWGDRPEVAERLPEGPSRSRRFFSAAEADDFDLGGRDQALVCGIETHVCVNQTVLDLAESGTEVQVAEDAVASRFAENRRVGLQPAEAGAVLTSVETALFELLGRAGTDEFKRYRS